MGVAEHQKSGKKGDRGKHNNDQQQFPQTHLSESAQAPVPAFRNIARLSQCGVAAFGTP
jgi:hypothetical protein